MVKRRKTRESRRFLSTTPHRRQSCHRPRHVHKPMGESGDRSHADRNPSLFSVEAKSPSDGQIKAAALVPSSSFRAGRGASVLSAASTPAAQAKSAALGPGPSATAVPRLPYDDVKPSASTASRASSGIVPIAAPVCGKSGKTGDVGELPGQDTMGGVVLQKTQG